MKKNHERLSHALHNESVCEYLTLRNDFADWVITSAFYSSLHFVSYKIFPFEVNIIEGKKGSIENIDQYKRYTNSPINKHELLADLVEKHCEKIFPDYDWLLSMSMTARYSNYQQDPIIARKAKALLNAIKKFCTS